MCDPDTELKRVLTEYSSDEFLEFLSANFAGDANFELFPSLAAISRCQSIVWPDRLVVSERDKVFFDKIREIIENNWEPLPPKQHETIGESLDFLSASCFFPQLSVAQLVLLALNLRAAPKRTLAVVLMVRNEGVFLLEWLAHYRLLGVEHFYIYTNNNDDESDDLLSSCTELGNITVITNELAQGVNPQRKAYQHATYLLDGLRDFEWVSFIDADEFFVSDRGYCQTLYSFADESLKAVQQDNVACIKVPWRWRFKEPTFAADRNLVSVSYSYGKITGQFKSINKTNQMTGMCEIHVPTADVTCTFAESGGSILNYDNRWRKFKEDYTGAVFEHYWGKTFAEFLGKKMRGDTLQLAAGQFKREHEQFFLWNPATDPRYWSPFNADMLIKLEHEITNILTNDRILAALGRVQEAYDRKMDDIITDKEAYEIFASLKKSIYRGYRNS